MPRKFIGGYRRDHEDVAWLEANAIDFPKFEGVFKDAPAVEEPWNLITQENQSSQGACFPAGTKVLMGDGNLKNIEDVQYGDQVITHAGRSRRVVDTMRRDYCEGLVEIQVKGWGTVKATRDHKFLVYQDSEEVWVSAENLSEGDLLILSKGVPEKSKESIDLSDYLSLEKVYEVDGKISTPSSVEVPKILPLDNLTCYVIGLYVAEGSSDFQNGIPCRATWTLHKDETDLEEKIGEFAGRMGLEIQTNIRKNSNAKNVRISSSIISEFFKNVCGRFSNHKKVPNFILEGSREQKLAFLRGYYAGDGSRKKYDGGRVAKSGNLVACRQTEASTSSETLSLQVSQIAVSLGMKPGRGVYSRRSHQKFDAHVIYLYSTDVSKLYEEENPKPPGQARNLIESSSGQTRKISSIRILPCETVEVYDFTVEDDHSFVANGITVHNCQGHALTTISEHCTRVASGDYTQLSRQYAYIETQRIDGLIGADRGSTIYGGVKLAQTKGLCKEELWRYTGKYHTKPTEHTLEECYADAAKRKIENHVRVKGYDDVYNFINLGLGGISIGIRWNSYCEAKVCERYAPRPGGGHAISLLFKSPRLDSQGRNYIWMNNSWGPNWANRGWSEWSPTFINELFDDSSYTVAYGLTDMADPTPRPQVYIDRMA